MSEITDHNGQPFDPYTPLVQRHLKIEAVTWGTDEQGYLLRYTGLLLDPDSGRAYDELAEALRPLGVTPLFRPHQKQHAVYLVKSPPAAKPSNPVVNLVMFALTVLGVLFAGATYGYAGPTSDDLATMLWLIFQRLDLGIPFALSLLGILLAHEFGHYLAARYHKTPVTLPYFIPLPLLSPFGTMGAFIQIKEPPKNRRVMLDIALAGPLAGLVVAIPVVLYGLATSQVGHLPPQGVGGFSLEGNSLLYLFLKYVTTGEMLPAPLSYDGLHPLLYWARYLVTGAPLPFGGLDVQMNSVAFAGWAGLLVTAMNLLPAGQLDGGHLSFVLFGEKSQRLLPFLLGGLALLALAWPGWWLWLGLLLLLGRVYMQPFDLITPLDPRRRALAILGLVVFVLVFIPIPMIDVPLGF